MMRAQTPAAEIVHLLTMRTRNYFTIFERIGILALACLVLLTASRLALVITHFDRVSATGGLVYVLMQGIRFDIILLGMILGPVAMLKPWFHTSPILSRAGRWLVPVYVGILMSLAVFIEASTASFIAEFDSRPNYLFVEYLQYPQEVFATVAGEKPIELAIVTLIAVLVGGTVITWLGRDPRWDARTSLASCVVATPIIAIIAVAMVRSTLDHRPVNASVAAFSQDSMVNQLPLNSPYTVIYAIYEQQRDLERDRIRYGSMDDNEVLDVIMSEADILPSDQVDPAAPTLHFQEATVKRERPLNLVIILQESLGAQFVGSLGGKDLTPEIDKLADEGIFFERLYATGTRSVRGIEALLTCISPRAQLSVVKLGETQQNFFTLASLLERNGYRTSFIYGGESHFDNMRQFFLGNGFQTVVDENDYEDPTFVGSWGVSDEDLFDRAHEEFMKSGDQPFFSLVFTSSNHSPFDIPENRVTPSEYGPRETAIKYADYALGRYIEKARQSSYWQDTVFLVVADHSVAMNGGTLVPIERFRIPGIILGDSIEPRRVRGITSQIDLLPTLLSMIGLDTYHPCIGRDLTLPQYADGTGRAPMQFHELQAFLENDRMVVLQHDLPPRTFDIDADGDMALIAEGDPALERKALAYALWGPMTIRNRAYFNYADTGQRRALSGSLSKRCVAGAGTDNLPSCK
jgi:phosphoglycerol transferase MdoB-like AlkP superfamily enzyme